MKKTKGIGIITVAMAAVLSIGLFSAAFIGINNFAFAAAAGKPESIPPVAATVGIPAVETTAPEDYQEPALTVLVVGNEGAAAGANALSPDEAAQIGALYIWDMFGESIDGKAVQMHYSAWNSHTRPYWHGNVVDSEETQALFSFTICALSGERIDIFKQVSRAAGDDAAAALSELLNDRNRRDELVNLRAILNAQATEDYAQAAEDYAAKHFMGAGIASVEFRNAAAAGFDLDENGKLFAAAQQLIYAVTDNTGREAEVAISLETKELLHILTQHNDVIPGYNYDAPGVG